MTLTTLDWNAVEPLNDLTFGRQVVQAEDPVLVLFWACGRSVRRALLPLAEEIAGAWGEVLHEYRVNLDENPFLAEHFGLRKDPALLLFNEGRVVGRWVDKRAEAAGCLLTLISVR